MNRQLRELILAVFLGFVLICSIPSNLIAGVELDMAADYFKQVAELVIRRDSSAIHKRFTPEVRATFSQKKFKDFLESTLMGQGKAKGTTINGLQVLPGGDYCEVSGELQFEKDSVNLTLTLKVVENGFQIHHLYLYFPKGTDLYYKFAQKAHKFLKDVFFPALKDRGVEEALAFVDSKVRAKVGDQLIKAVLEPLKDVTIRKIKTYDNANTTEGKTHEFVLVGDYKNSLCEVEIIVAESEQDFKILDVNIKALNQN